MLSISCVRQPTAVALQDTCKQTDKQFVKIEGYFRLPESTDPLKQAGEHPGTQALLLVEKGNGTGSFVKAMVTMTSNKERNRLDTLPVSYTYDDLHIYTDSGARASPDEKIMVTGEVSRETIPCVLQVEKIETVSMTNK